MTIVFLICAYMYLKMILSYMLPNHIGHDFEDESLLHENNSS